MQSQAKPDAFARVSALTSSVSIIGLILVSVLIAGIAVPARADSSAAIWTDAPAYAPESLVTIFGTGFTSSTDVSLLVLVPDGTNSSWTTQTDGYGNFTTYYQLDSVNGTYTATAEDGTNIATTTFDDAPFVGGVVLTPDVRLVLQGGSATYTVTVTRGLVPVVPFNTVLTLVASTLPASVTATFASSTLHIGAGDSSGSTTLTLATVSATLVGSHQFQVNAAGPILPNIDHKISGVTTLVVVPVPTLTNQGGCSFDTNPTAAGNQFRLIFTQDPSSPSTYFARASNPGQFGLNAFSGGLPANPVSLSLSIPYPFVTQGSVPVHVYSGLAYSGGCLVPSGDDLTDSFAVGGASTVTPSGHTGLALGDYGSSPSIGTTSATLTITGTVPASGIVYVQVHLDFGLKSTAGYGKDSSNNAINPLTAAVLIPNLATMSFSVSGDLSSTFWVQNENVFKHDPGFAGIVLDRFGTPIQGVKVQVFSSSGTLIGTAYTDRDGFYSLNYKQTGKAATYYVKLPAYGLSKAITLKANAIVVVDFAVV